MGGPERSNASGTGIGGPTGGAAPGNGGPLRNAAPEGVESASTPSAQTKPTVGASAETRLPASPGNVAGARRANQSSSRALTKPVDVPDRPANPAPPLDGANKLPSVPPEPASLAPGAPPLDVRPTEKPATDSQEKGFPRNPPNTPAQTPSTPPQPTEEPKETTPKEIERPKPPGLAPPAPFSINVSPTSKFEAPSELLRQLDERFVGSIVKSAHAGATATVNPNGANTRNAVTGRSTGNVSVTATATVEQRFNAAFIWRAPPAVTPPVSDQGLGTLVERWIGRSFDFRWLPVALAVLGLVSGVVGKRALGRRTVVASALAGTKPP